MSSQTSGQRAINMKMLYKAFDDHKIKYTFVAGSLFIKDIKIPDIRGILVTPEYSYFSFGVQTDSAHRETSCQSRGYTHSSITSAHNPGELSFLRKHFDNTDDILKELDYWFAKNNH